MSYSPFGNHTGLWNRVTSIQQELDELKGVVEKLQLRIETKEVPATEAPADVWPDDENHRLGPNGERLVSVDLTEEWCGPCFYRSELVDCNGRECEAKLRKDKREIHWELAGDRK